MNHPRVPAAVACTVLSVVLVAGCTSSESVPTNEGSRAAEGGSSTTDVPSESTTTSPETDPLRMYFLLGPSQPSPKATTSTFRGLTKQPSTSTARRLLNWTRAAPRVAAPGRLPGG